jgi:hypothetical protein
VDECVPAVGEIAALASSPSRRKPSILLPFFMAKVDRQQLLASSMHGASRLRTSTNDLRLKQMKVKDDIEHGFKVQGTNFG